MSGSVTIEAAAPPHAALLAALQGQCFEDGWSQASIEEILGSPGTFGLVALACGTPVGFALARLAGDEAELLSLGVLVSRRRQGIGKILLADIIDRARTAGAQALFLEVAESNDAARLLYSARGFTAVGRRPDYYRRPNTVPIAALTLRLTLAS